VNIELGLDTFGDATQDAEGTSQAHHVVIREILDQALLADQVGLDVFNIGEHHRDDFAVTAPDIILAAAAARTERIKLGTAVTVLSSEDPIRVYERFATLDAVSSGRAEVTVGRGSFTESFPLFGYSLSDYEELFEQKLELFTALLAEGPVTWSGTMRPPLADQEVYPKTEGGRITTWVATRPSSRRSSSSSPRCVPRVRSPSPVPTGPRWSPPTSTPRPKRDPCPHGWVWAVHPSRSSARHGTASR
jgi:alkanesulfonate monooxygenase SsuD/methylene tetrahydromethanopterin reductase-like flavin-dependent oxidoreductase (luciferase family)